MSHAMGLSWDAATHFNSILKIELHKHDTHASRIWNVDEFGLVSVHHPLKIMALKGMKQVGILTTGEHGKTIAIICCFNAAGTHLLQHLFLHPKT